MLSPTRTVDALDGRKAAPILFLVADCDTFKPAHIQGARRAKQILGVLHVLRWIRQVGVAVLLARPRPKETHRAKASFRRRRLNLRRRLRFIQYT